MVVNEEERGVERKKIEGKKKNMRFVMKGREEACVLFGGWKISPRCRQKAWDYGNITDNQLNRRSSQRRYCHGYIKTHGKNKKKHVPETRRKIFDDLQTSKWGP